MRCVLRVAVRMARGGDGGGEEGWEQTQIPFAFIEITDNIFLTISLYSYLKKGCHSQ